MADKKEWFNLPAASLTVVRESWFTRVYHGIQGPGLTLGFMPIDSRYKLIQSLK